MCAIFVQFLLPLPFYGSTVFAINCTCMHFMVALRASTDRKVSESAINLSSAMWLAQRINKVIEIGAVKHASNATKRCVANSVFAAMAVAQWRTGFTGQLRSFLAIAFVFIDILSMAFWQI